MAYLPQLLGTGTDRSKWLLRVGVEVVLISMGVFLALMGEQWQENGRNRELAETSLRRLRTEIQANRKSVAAVEDYHDNVRKQLQAYFASDGPKTAETFDVSTPRGVGPVFFEQSAWDLALATQSLVHIEADLAFALARAYAFQERYGEMQRAIVQSTIYGRSMTQDFEGYWRSMLSFLGDLGIFDPTLLKAYDDVLPQIDRALGE